MYLTCLIAMNKQIGKHLMGKLLFIKSGILVYCTVVFYS